MRNNRSMDNAIIIGDKIKNKRLELNLRMEDVSNECDITRATLWSIERGTGSASLNTVLKVMDFLGLSIEVTNVTNRNDDRERATRINTIKDKKANRFIVMCIEQYASSENKSGKEVYKELKEQGVMKLLNSDYEDLHGMSTEYLNDYLKSISEGQ